MKYFRFLVLAASPLLAHSQTVTFSNDVIKPQVNLISGLTYPGITGNNYLVNSYAGGGAWFDGKVKSLIYSFNINTLAKTEVEKNWEAGTLSDKDYYNIGDYQVNDRLVRFYLRYDDKKQYPLFIQLYGADGKLIKEEKTPLQIDNDKIDIWNNKRDHAMKTGSSLVTDRSFGEKTLLTAVTSNTIDKNNSMVRISEWDENMKAVFDAEYKLPLVKWYASPTDRMNGDFEDAKVLEVKDDNNGFIYALVQSGNPADSKDQNLFWIYQFKKSDKNYMKTFKSEFSDNLMPYTVDLKRTEDGTVFVSVSGFEDPKKARNLGKINKVYVGGFNPEGNLEKWINQKLGIDLLELFDASKVAKQKKEQFIGQLQLQHVKRVKDGSTYLVWEQVVYETTGMTGVTMGTTTSGTIHTYYTCANALVQYFGKDGKMLWEKPIYKEQTSKDISPYKYGSIEASVNGDQLYLFYADDPKNADKQVTDKKVEKFSTIKFDDKDLAGIFALSFNKNGLDKRVYIPWPKEKLGFAIGMTSIKLIKAGEFMASARKLRQSAMSFDEKELTVLKFTF